MSDDPVKDGLAEGFEMPPDYTVSQWADKYVILPSEAAAEPGRWRTDRAPYQRAMMDDIIDPHIRVLVFKTSAQVGKTSAMQNGIGYHIHHAPAPMLMILPTLDMSKAFVKDKLDPLLRSTPVLSDRVIGDREKSRKADNTQSYKGFPGGFLSVTGANSPTSLRMRSVKIVWADEVDAYPVVAGDEGDPLKLAHKRTQTFWDSKLICCSTPAVKGVSRISSMFEKSDQRFFFVPCPDCNTWQRLVWERVPGDPKTRAVVWTPGKPETAGYCCEHCGTLWDDGDIKRQVKFGEWRATAPFTGIRGYHIWQIYSPWSSLEEIVREFEESEGRPALRQVWVNTVLGEEWDGDETAGVTADMLHARREPYETTKVPAKACVLTAGVDVQNDRLEVLIKAHGADNESWCLQYFPIYGDPTSATPWNQLAEVLNVKLYHPIAKRGLGIEAVAIDSGFCTQHVYNFAAKYWPMGKRWYAIKGVSGPARVAWEPSKMKIKGGIKLYLVGVDTMKEHIYKRLGTTEPGRDYLHFPLNEQFEKPFFEMLTVERIRTVHDTTGHAHREWYKPEGARNETLDLNVYADAAHTSLNVNHRDRLAAWLGTNREGTLDPAAIGRMMAGG